MLCRVTTSIADLCHTENVQDRVVGTCWFKEVIGAAKMVGAEYKIPHRDEIGGCLLNKNAAVYKQGNFDEVIKDGLKFGYTAKVTAQR